MLTPKVGHSGMIAFGAFKIGKFDLINRGGQTLDHGAVKVVVDAILVVAKPAVLRGRTSVVVCSVQIEEISWVATHNAGVGEPARDIAFVGLLYDEGAVVVVAPVTLAVVA